MHAGLNRSETESDPNQRKMSKAHTWYNNLPSEDSTINTIGVGPVCMLRQRFS
jgi:hypothetical protein